MENRVEITVQTNEAASPWYRIAVATAVVGGVFSVIVLTLLVVNYFHRRVIDAGREKQWEAMKVEIRNRADTEQLISEIRQFDLELRHSRIRRLAFSRKGCYLLFGGVAVLLAGVRWAGVIRKKTPVPQLVRDTLDKQMHQAAQARWAITIGLAILASGALLLILLPVIDFGKSATVSSSYPATEEISKNWPRFRGPGGLGVSASTNMPISWNGKTGEGILWKSKVPLPGYNSPVVWGERVFLSGADGNECKVYCFDALSGNLLWTRPVINVQSSPEKPLKLTSEGAGYASPTVVTDGRRVCAIFATGDVGCFDLEGRNIWSRSLGVPDSAYGYASSLEGHRNLLLIQYDQGAAEDKKSKLIALNASSGQTVWETPRPVPNSWASPIVVKVGEQYQVITCGDPWVIGYDPANGAELWRAKCIGGEIAPSPIYTGGLVLAAEPYNKIVAIRPDGRGDVTKTHIAWSIEDSAPDICCPVGNGEFAFFLATTGALSCYKLPEGKKLWEEDLKGNFLASPSLVGNRLYLLSEKGVMIIAEAGTKYKQIAKCELGEDCHASPAFVDGRIYIRGLESLYCIGSGASQRP